MTREEAENAIKEYAEYAAQAHLSAPAAWFVGEAAGIVLETIRAGDTVISAKPFPYNRALHEAEAKLDARLASIDKVQKLAEKALTGALFLLLQVAKGGI